LNYHGTTILKLPYLSGLFGSKATMPNKSLMIIYSKAKRAVILAQRDGGR